MNIINLNTQKIFAAYRAWRVCVLLAVLRRSRSERSFRRQRTQRSSRPRSVAQCFTFAKRISCDCAFDESKYSNAVRRKREPRREEFHRFIRLMARGIWLTSNLNLMSQGLEWVMIPSTTAPLTSLEKLERGDLKSAFNDGSFLRRLSLVFRFCVAVILPNLIAQSLASRMCDRTGAKSTNEKSNVHKRKQRTWIKYRQINYHNHP